MAESAYVQKARKQLNYTISPIGTADDLAKWKLAQAIREEQWQKERAALTLKVKESAAAIVRGDKEPVLTDIDRAELKYRESRQKPKTQESRELPPRRSYEEIMGHPAEQLSRAYYSPLKALKRLCASVWHNAFRGETQK